MAGKNQNAKDLLTLYKTLFIELPISGAKSTLGIAKDNELENHAWNAYDSWIRLMSSSTSALYQNPFFGDALGRNLPGLLRSQQITNALSGAFFAVVRTITGMASAVDVQAVRGEVRDMRLELRSLIAALPGRDALADGAALERDDAFEEEFIRALDGRLQLARRAKAKAA